jgi:quercetin dioxygenase-like cupin family protein
MKGREAPDPFGRHAVDPHRIPGPSRVRVMAALVGAGAIVIAIGQHVQIAAAAQRGQSNFAGGTPSAVDAAAVRTTRLRFPAGSRSNWHTHSWGQLLMIEQGKGRTQVRGGAVQEVLPGQPWWTPAGVEHWHGAAPDQEALQLTIYEGTVSWMDPVSDKEYQSPPQRK